MRFEQTLKNSTLGMTFAKSVLHKLYKHAQGVYLCTTVCHTRHARTNQPWTCCYRSRNSARSWSHDLSRRGRGRRGKATPPPSSAPRSPWPSSSSARGNAANQPPGTPFAPLALALHGLPTPHPALRPYGATDSGSHGESARSLQALARSTRRSGCNPLDHHVAVFWSQPHKPNKPALSAPNKRF